MSIFFLQCYPPFFSSFSLRRAKHWLLVRTRAFPVLGCGIEEWRLNKFDKGVRLALKQRRLFGVLGELIGLEAIATESVPVLVGVL